jgi:CheY-like chemotaxis protein/plasmid stabilization system protein ParE
MSDPAVLAMVAAIVVGPIILAMFRVFRGRLASQSLPAAIAAERLDAGRGSSRPVRVLVVEASPDLRRRIVRVFADHPEIEVAGEACDGEEALALVTTLEPDLITLGLEMPRMDGFAFLRALMSKAPTPVIVVSSESQRENVFRALEQGALDFIPLRAGRAAEGIGAEVSAELLEKVALVRALSPSFRPGPLGVKRGGSFSAESTGSSSSGEQGSPGSTGRESKSSETPSVPVDLPENVARFVEAEVLAGRFPNAAAAVRAFQDSARAVIGWGDTHWQTWLARSGGGFYEHDDEGVLRAWLEHPGSNLGRFPTQHFLTCLRGGDAAWRAAAGACLRVLLDDMRAGHGVRMDDRSLSSFLDDCIVRSQGHFNDGHPGPFQTFDPDSRHPGQDVEIVFSKRACDDIFEILQFQRSCGAGVATEYCNRLRDTRNRLGAEPSALAELDRRSPRLWEVSLAWLIYVVPTDDAVQVARVLHDWSHWESDLFGGVSSGDEW